MTIISTSPDGKPSIIIDRRHVDIDDAYNTEPMFNDAEAFGGIVRLHFPGMLDIASDGAVQQVNDQELVVWNGYGFRVQLDNGASFNIQITQHDYATEDTES